MMHHAGLTSWLQLLGELCDRCGLRVSDGVLAIAGKIVAGLVVLGLLLAVWCDWRAGRRGRQPPDPDS